MRRRRDYARAFAEGVAVRDGLLKLWAVRNGLEVTRLGTAVSRQAARRAVDRNRTRRRLREAFRHVRARLPAGLDIVVVPLRANIEPPLAALEASLLSLARQAAFALATQRAPRGGEAARQAGAAPRADDREVPRGPFSTGPGPRSEGGSP